MSCAARAIQFLRAYTGIGKLNRLTDLRCGNPEMIMGMTFDFNRGYLRPIQEPAELLSLLQDVIRLNPCKVLEIGTAIGGTLYLWTRFSRPDATIVSIDLRGGKFGGGYSFARSLVYRRFARERQRLHLLRADSHDRFTLDEAKRLLGEKIDFLFLDGDHTYEGIKMDWEMYSPLVRSGGIVAFHDVAGNYDSIRVKQLWDSIKADYSHAEYILRSDGLYGIGVIFKK